jgi:hypothetical protein
VRDHRGRQPGRGHREHAEQGGEERKGLLLLEEHENRDRDAHAIAVGVELAHRADRPSAVRSFDLGDWHSERERMNRELGLGLEASRERWERLHEAA